MIRYIIEDFYYIKPPGHSLGFIWRLNLVANSLRKLESDRWLRRPRLPLDGNFRPFLRSLTRVAKFSPISPHSTNVNFIAAEKGPIQPSRDRVISHPLSPSFLPYLLRTQPSHPRSRNAKTALTHSSCRRHPPDYWP